MFFIQNPLDQFEIRDLIILDFPLLNNIHISLTSIAGYITISFLIISIFNIMTNKNATIVHKNWNLGKETIHDTIYSIVVNQINKNRGNVFSFYNYFIHVYIS